MLKLISLHTLNKIFDQEAIIKLSPKAKIAYMQCVTFHFEDLAPKLANLQPFELQKGIINQRSLPLFQELEKAGLVINNETTITFVNHWAKHIDKSKMERAPAHEYLGLMNYKKAIEYKPELLKHQGFYEITKMQCKISADRVTELINMFFKEQDAHEESFPNYQAASRHCLSWIRQQCCISNYKNKSIIKTNATTQQFKPGKELGSL